jgi:hypothetical protein
MIENIDAYLSGFFDGEGNIRIDTSLGQLKQRRFNLRIEVKQVDPHPLNVFAERFGGTVRRQRRNNLNPNWRDTVEWTASSSRAVEALRAMRPWLIVKGPQADVAFQFQDVIDNRGIASRVPLSDEELKIRQDLADEITRLKWLTYEDVPLAEGEGTRRWRENMAKPKLPKLKRVGKRPNPVGSKGKGQKAKKPTIEVLRQEYQELGVIDLARKYQVVTTTVYNWLDSYGIPRNGVTDQTLERFKVAQRKSFDALKEKLWTPEMIARAKKRPGSAKYHVE